MADTFQTISDEIVRIRIAERQQKRAVEETFRPARQEILVRCAALGHLFHPGGRAPDLWGTEPKLMRTCVVCNMDEA